LYRIRYDCVNPQALSGTLLYIKSSLCSELPVDVAQYRVAHRDFPHESTFNQFFQESQFESYRRLGSHVIDHILSSIANTNHAESVSLDEFFQRADAYVSRPNSVRGLTQFTEFLESGRTSIVLRS